MEMRHNTWCIRGMIRLVVVLVCLLGLTAARPALCLAEDYPYAVIFLQMARRGLADYSARNGVFPVAFNDLVASGYTAYHFPASTELSYSVAGGTAVFSTNGHPSFSHGMQREVLEYEVSLPRTGLFSIEEWWLAVDGDPDNRALQQITTWHFEGAEWLNAGYGWYDVEPALRFDRLTTHLIWASCEFGADLGYMPQNLAELEAFVGVDRNPAGWQGVNVVYSLNEVEYSAGNLFVGWDGAAWVVSCNLGPEIKTERFVQLDNGKWIFTVQSALLY